MAEIPEWKPFSEMPAGMMSALLGKPGLPTWIIAHKDARGVWRMTMGVISAEIIGPESYYFLPLTIIPPLPV